MPPTLVIGDAVDFTPETRWSPKPSDDFSTEGTLLIFDWDDTLLCTGWLRSRGYSLKDNMPPTQEMLDACEKLAKVAWDLLTSAIQLGRVIIITNAMNQWVEKSCALFMPRLLPIISGIPIISAQARYRHFSHLPVVWKEKAFFDEVVVRIALRPHDGRFNVISIGDGIPEQEAMRSFSRAGYYLAVDTLTKSIKLMDCPDPDILISQLEHVTASLDSLALHSESFDLKIGIMDI